MITWEMQDGDIVLQKGCPVILTENECLRQRLVNKIKLDKGGWFFDPDRGIPWIDIYNNKNVTERLVRSHIQRVLQEDAEVTKVRSINIDFDRASRTLIIYFEVESKYGVVRGNI
ncbi:MAG: hypothetical protein AB1444_00335 [Spirochaetota bacterium]